MTDGWTELKAIFIKTILPIIMGLSVKLAILSKKEDITLKKGVICSICGVAAAWLTVPIVSDMSDHWSSITIAVVAMSGEKIGFYVLYKFNIENLLDFITTKKK